MKILIIYYSLSGSTKQTADVLAAKLPADKKRVKDQEKRTGIFGMMLTIYQILLAKPSHIQTLKIDISQYDLIILGTPVWMMRLASPMRALINQEKYRLPKVAFFCTESSSGATAVFRTMEELCETTPIATLEITQSDMAHLDDSKKLSDFLNTCQKAVSK
ncbi:MAG: flavodoxin [Oleispira sp.]|jgi:flavodoxin